MTNYKAKDVDDYIKSAIDITKPHLREIRSTVMSALPEAEEKICYGKPYYKQHGWIVGFDVYKNHIGFEVWDGIPDHERGMLEKAGYKTGSVTFQIPYDQDVPTDIIKQLAANQVKLNLVKQSK